MLDNNPKCDICERMFSSASARRAHQQRNKKCKVVVGLRWLLQSYDHASTGDEKTDMMFSDDRTGIEKEVALFVAKLKYVDHVPFHVIQYMFYGINVFANKRCEFNLIPPKYEDSQALRQLALRYSPVHDVFKRMGMAMIVESRLKRRLYA